MTTGLYDQNEDKDSRTKPYYYSFQDTHLKSSTSALKHNLHEQASNMINLQAISHIVLIIFTFEYNVVQNLPSINSSAIISHSSYTNAIDSNNSYVPSTLTSSTTTTTTITTTLPTTTTTSPTSQQHSSAAQSSYTTTATYPFFDDKTQVSTLIIPTTTLSSINESDLYLSAETETAPIVFVDRASENLTITTTTPIPILTTEKLIVSESNDVPVRIIMPPPRNETRNNISNSNFMIFNATSITNKPTIATTTTPLPITTSSRPLLRGIQFLLPNSRNLNKCMSEVDCNNQGACLNNTCYCQPGFSGHKCTYNIDECRQVQEPCSNNGTCIDGINSYSCICAKGYKGETCDEAINMCVGNPCQNNATCVNHKTDYSCTCLPGFKGKQCEEDTNDCLNNPCKNNATCTDKVNDYECDCKTSGYSGKNCDINIDDCFDKPCALTAKQCVDKVGDFECICYKGFRGKRCEIDINECEPNPCENNGTCRQNSLPLDNINLEHSIYDGKEQNISANLDRLSGYTCECGSDFYGDRCEEKKKCSTKPHKELCKHSQAECINLDNSYECVLSASFDGTGERYASYKVIGEFELKEIFIKYKSLVGGLLMSFETTNREQPYADLVLNKTGLYLDGNPIKRGPEVKFEDYTDGGERNIMVGLDVDIPIKIKTITLARHAHFDFDNAFKGCLKEVRLNSHLVPLIQVPGSNSSFEHISSNLDLGTCQTCFKTDCNKGTCDDNSEHCICPHTFTGSNCEIDINECEINPNLCMNGGTCENKIGGYHCKCRDGYKGEKCAEISDICRAKPPCNQGTCKSINGMPTSYICECPSSHIGKNCEKKRDCMNECHGQHSHCVNNITCACLPGNRAERIMCEYIPSCYHLQGELCLNGGRCEDTDFGGYQCVCPESFHGPICQHIVDKPPIDILLLIVITCVGLLVATCATISLVIFKSVRKARATRGTYSPSTQEKFGNSASDILKPPPEERLI